jgi:hypothetical protein
LTSILELLNCIMTYQKKTILFLSFLSLITCQNLFGQIRQLPDEEINHSTASKIKFIDTITCDKIDGWIKSDIKNKTIFLFLDGGIAPKVYTNDKEFENKYGVYFYDFGDLPPDSKCIIKYNFMVFDYLTNIYGRKWIKEIRKDITGLSKWKKNKNRNS